jgi:hypothetical protein
VEGNDTLGDHGQVCEGDGALIGLSHGMVEVCLRSSCNHVIEAGGP